MKKTAIVLAGTLLSLIVLSACTNFTNAAQVNPAPLPVQTKDHIEDITPENVKKGADTLDDAALIAFFAKVYVSATGVNNWLENVCILYDESDILPTPASIDVESTLTRPIYARVTGVDSMETLRECFEAVFSQALLDSFVYPSYFENNAPKFLESDGTLYQNINTGGGLQQEPDYNRATVTDKTESAFVIEVPMVGVTGDRADVATYSYRLIVQNGYWVFDAFYLYDDFYLSYTGFKPQ